MDFLVKNLGYVYPIGRESVLEVRRGYRQCRVGTNAAAVQVIHAALLKFPAAVVNEYAEFLFLPLVVRLVNEVRARASYHLVPKAAAHSFLAHAAGQPRNT